MKGLELLEEDFIAFCTFLTSYYNDKAHQLYNGIDVSVGDIKLLIANRPHDCLLFSDSKLGMSEIMQGVRISRDSDSFVWLRTLTTYYAGKYYCRLINNGGLHFAEELIVATNMERHEIDALKALYYLSENYIENNYKQPKYTVDNPIQ